MRECGLRSHWNPEHAVTGIALLRGPPRSGRATL
jgi:hypothetical protein